MVVTARSSRRTRTAREPVPIRQATVLVVGFASSIHSVRWVRMLLGRGLRLVFLPVNQDPLSPEFGPVTPVFEHEDMRHLTDRDLAVFDLARVPESEIEEAQAKLGYEPWKPAWLSAAPFTHPAHIAAAIRAVRPDVIHSMVVQFGGYLCAATRELLGEAFPKWLLSNWGSDIFLFRMLPEHRGRISDMLSLIDAYHSECRRDIGIAKQMGFRKTVFPPIPASGGMNFVACPALETLCPPSQRREILIKGYQGWSGRALNILAAVHLAADALRGYRIRITLAESAVRETAAAIAANDGLEIVCEKYLESHEAALSRLSAARAVVGLGISDGISTTLLEAMTVGTFPIQGDRSGGAEWISPPETGILVSPHDPAALAAALRRAVTDDALVETAALRNRKVVEERWNAEVNGAVAASCYHALIAQPRAVTA